MGDKRLSFTVTGAFVTKTAREWFWDEHKPWEKIEEFLLACMCGTDKSREELAELAKDVVFGRAEFVGNSADGSYGLVRADGSYGIAEIEKMSKWIEELKRENGELRNQLDSLRDRIIDEDCEWLLDDGERDGPESSPLLMSFLEQRQIEREHKDNYGWLEPGGEFHPVEFAEHQSWAYQYIKEKFGDLYHELRSSGKLDRAGDYLTEKGWVLLHNPGMGVAHVTKREGSRLTKARREFLFDYYTERGRADLAQEFLED